MKQFLITIFLIAGVALYAQGPRSAYVNATAGTDSVIGKTTATIDIPEYLHQEYDYSYQVVPTAVGVGDSVNATIQLFQANDLAGSAWSAVVGATGIFQPKSPIFSFDASGVKIESTAIPGKPSMVSL